MRQVIEQFGVCRRRSKFSKIIRSANDAFAEMMLPDAVHHDASGHGIIRVGQPASELQAAAAFGNRVAIIAGEQSRETTWYDGPKPIITAANMDVRVFDPLVNTGRD